LTLRVIASHFAYSHSAVMVSCSAWCSSLYLDINLSSRCKESNIICTQKKTQE